MFGDLPSHNSFLLINRSAGTGDTAPRGQLTRRAQEIADRLYDIPHSGRRSLSVDTLLNWTARYRKDGFPALIPKPRQDRADRRAPSRQKPPH